MPTAAGPAVTVTLHLDRFLASTLEPALAARMEATGVAMLAAATATVPVDTGALRASLGYRYDRAAHRLMLYAGTDHSVFVELGTRRMAAQPYLRPALRAVGPAWGNA